MALLKFLNCTFCDGLISLCASHLQEVWIGLGWVLISLELGFGSTGFSQGPKTCTSLLLICSELKENITTGLLEFSKR